MNRKSPGLLSMEHKKKISAAQKGRRLTPEHRQKLSDAHPRKRGAENPNWKGGRSNTADGYVRILVPGHPRADVNNYVFEHIVVAEGILQRPLIYISLSHPNNEVVHHLNEIRDDNDEKNLQVMTHSVHTKLHNQK